MLSKITNMFRRKLPNTVTEFEVHRKRGFFKEARKFSESLRGRYHANFENHLSEVYGKHLSRVTGYATRADALAAIKEYADLQWRYQFHDQPPAEYRHWSPKPVGNGPEAA